MARLSTSGRLSLLSLSNSERTIQLDVEIVRVFVRLRGILAVAPEMSRYLAALGFGSPRPEAAHEKLCAH